MYDSYPVIWKKKDARPKLCFMGCPHMSLDQLTQWTEKIEQGLKEAGKERVAIPTVFTAAPAVLKKFEETPYASRRRKAGVVISYICPLMYMTVSDTHLDVYKRQVYIVVFLILLLVPFAMVLRRESFPKAVKQNFIWYRQFSWKDRFLLWAIFIFWILSLIHS